jgi:hypothetical protein
MKKIVLFLLLFVIYIGNSWGQSTVSGTSTYRIEISGYVGVSGSPCGSNITRGLQWIVGKRQNGTYYTFVQGSDAYPENGHGLTETNFSNTYNFSKTNKIIEITYGTTRRTSQDIGGCQSTRYTTQTHAITICDKKSYNFETIGLNQPGNSTESFFPIVTLDTPTESNRYLTEDGYLTISLTDNIDTQYYNWEYSVGGTSNFQSFPSTYNNQATLRLKGSDFLTSSAVGSAIYIRVNMGYCAGSNRVSNTIDLEYRIAAPRILNVTEIDKTCANGATGRFKVQLDRALFSGESLLVDYHNLTTLAIGTVSNPVMEDDNSFYLTNLDAGNYTIRVSGFCNGVSTYPNEKTGNTLASFLPMSYSTTEANNIACYGANNGSITIGASGGDGNYILHWKPEGGSYQSETFSPATTKTMSNLPPGRYEYYVTDGHDCELRNLDGSVKTIEETLTQPTKALDFTVLTTVEPSGYNRSDGSVAIEGDGGTPLPGNDYTVIWTNKQTGLLVATVENDPSGTKFKTTAKNIPAGTYVVELKDANNCVYTNEITIDQPDELIVNVENTQQILCNGDANGELVAHVSGGVLESGQHYIYRWYKKTGVSYQPIDRTDSIASGLDRGDYKVEVKDRSRIENIAEQAFVLNEPAVLSTTITSQNVTCFGGNNGHIRIEVTGGTKPYNLHYRTGADGEWQTMQTNESDAVFVLNTLVAGDYWFEIKDQNQCTVSDLLMTRTIQQPVAPLEITNVAIKSPSGPGRSDGRITLKITGGTPNDVAPRYTVSWENGQGQMLPYSYYVNDDDLFVAILENLADGNYSVEVKDKNYAAVANACYVAENFRLYEPDPLVVSLEHAALIACYGESMGSLVAHVSGGVQKSTAGLPYNYQWFEVKNDVEIVLTGETDSIISALPVGYYKVKISDGSDPLNETESTLFQITQPPLLVTSLTTRNISCYEQNDGFIHIGVSGGVGNYRLFCKREGIDAGYNEFPINQADNTFQLDALFAGRYSIYVQDGNGCYAVIDGETVREINLSQPDSPLAIVSTQVVDASGFGRSDGSITIAVAGGTPNPDNTYNVVWKNETGEAVSSTANLPAGSYSVVVTDRNYDGAYLGTNASCFVSESYVINEPDELLGSIEEPHVVSCFGMSDGQLVAHIQGGTRHPNPTVLPYQYTWYAEQDGAFTPITGETDSILSDCASGNYRLIIEDYSRTPNTLTLDYYLVQPDVLKATPVNRSVVCGATTTLSVTISGGTPPYRYEWNTGDTTPEVSGVGAGNYVVYIHDSRDCETTAIVRVSTPSGLIVTESITHPVCYQATNGTIQLQVSGGTAPYSYLWNTGHTSKDLNNIQAGTYSVTVTDADGCSYSNYFILTEPEPLRVTIGEDRTLCNGQQHTITPELSGDTTAVRYAWTGPNNFRSTAPTVSVNQEGAYQLTITNNQGCEASDNLFLSVKAIDISSEIVIASHVFVNDTIVIVNISNPEPERFEWLVRESDSLTVIEQTAHYIRLVFRETGQYPIGFRSYIGDCYEDNLKSVTVNEGGDIEENPYGESIIEKFVVSPNPNNGRFTVSVELTQISSIRLRLVNIASGIVVSDKRQNGEKEYTIDYDLPLASGIYVVVLETASGNRSIKMIAK